MEHGESGLLGLCVTKVAELENGKDIAFATIRFLCMEEKIVQVIDRKLKIAIQKTAQVCLINDRIVTNKWIIRAINSQQSHSAIFQYAKEPSHVA